MNAAAETIYEIVDPNANIIFGAVIDEKMQGEVRVTVIATGFSGEKKTSSHVASTVQTPPTVQKTPPAPKPSEKDESQPPSPSLDIPEFLQRRRFPRG